MQAFQIYDATQSNPLWSNDPIYYTDSGRKALDMYFKEIGFNGKVKVSADNNVHFKVTPIYIDETGKKFYDRRKKCLWYQIQ